jgi:lipopolysaccharide biosynthesis protein
MSEGHNLGMSGNPSQNSLADICDEEVAAFRASGEFDEDWYLSEYPDVARVGIEPARHYLWLGTILGRQPRRNMDVMAGVADDIIKRDALVRIDRNAAITSDEDWLIFVAYSANGALSLCQQHQIASFAEAGYAVALVINTDSFEDLVDPACEIARIVIVRENLGYDFGAWKHAVELLGGLAQARSVSFTNDSILSGPNGVDANTHMRERIADAPADICFLTQNREVRQHCQSFFFTFRQPALVKQGLALIAATPLYRDKDSLIHQIEVHLSDRLRDAGMTVDTLFSLDVEENPTIHHWETLLDHGFPFIKVQLITAGIVSIDDARLQHRLGSDIHALLKAHVAIRGIVRTPIQRLPALPRRALAIEGLFNEYGAQQAANPAATLLPTIKVPLAGELAPPARLPNVLAIIHGYYTDLLPGIFAQLRALDIDMRLLVTTDTAEKQAVANQHLAAYELRGQTVVCQNRGRDVAPFLIEGARHLEDAEVILHLHTKKSPHDSVYAGWDEFLRANLVGSRDIALSILAMFASAPVGIVYSDHFPAVNDLRNWGYDFDHARHLLARIGCTIDAGTPLEFPTSTMFWAQREALEPLFALGLTYEDFEPEAGQIDGTLAHAIERSLLYIAEHSGFGHLKVTARDTATDPAGPLMHLRADSVGYALNRPMPRLDGGLTLRSEFYDSVPEIYPVGIARSNNRRLRLNAILPTMKPEKIYGGITTALAVVRQIADQMGHDIDLRVLITSDSVDRPSVEALTSRLHRPFIQARPSEDVSGNTIVGIAQAQHEPISVRAGDMYIATAWWTADLGFRLIDQQKAMFAVHPLMAYVIQDYEPGFYNWSNHYALADATYRRPDETIAIINSEELAGFMQNRHSFVAQQYVPYELHPTLATLIKPTIPERLILAYGRPGVSRNCFELLCEGLRVWQGRNPRANTGFDIVFAGEEFDRARLKGLENARTVGKMSIEEYASMLNKACAGVSLMVSPHPSYPPLEMASAGCVTVTNGYEGKDLGRRSDRIISMAALTPSALADALDKAIGQVDFANPKPISPISDLEIEMLRVDYGSLASLMLNRAQDG